MNGVIHPSSFSKHKPGMGFASVSGMRRCVIDLSDSEEEGDEGIMRGVGSHPKDRWGRRSGYSSPAPLVSSASMPGGWITPPGMTAAGIASGATMSPAALLEKETEIRKMREMIAQRERDRQKKLTVVCGIECSWAATYIHFSQGQYPTSIPTADLRLGIWAHLYPSSKRNLMLDCLRCLLQATGQASSQTDRPLLHLWKTCHRWFLVSEPPFVYYELIIKYQKTTQQLDLMVSQLFQAPLFTLLPDIQLVLISAVFRLADQADLIFVSNP